MSDKDKLLIIEAMLKKNGMWVSQEHWVKSDKDDELLVSIDFLIQYCQELRGDFK